MPGRTPLGQSVFEATVARLTEVYAAGHRVLHSFSGGKDSLVVVECAIIAARATGRLPVELVMRDEELGWPDHYEYCERIAQRPEVDITWIVANEAHWWAYDRRQPFWWAFDPRLEPSQWVREPPPYAKHIDAITIEAINSTARFPPPADRELVVTMGLRADESRRRMMGVFSQGGWKGSLERDGKRKAWPIYDWHERDVWRAIAEFGWDLPKAYTQLYRAGVSRRANRMGAFLNPYAAPMMPTAAKIWPSFFDRLYRRFPGLREGVRHWEHCIRPTHRDGERWVDTFWREDVDTAPLWIAARSEKLAEAVLRRHNRNASGSHDPRPFDDTEQCFACGAGRGSWQSLTKGMFLGDPYSETSATGLPYVQPEMFRPELAGTPAGQWGTGGRQHPG